MGRGHGALRFQDPLCPSLEQHHPQQQQSLMRDIKDSSELAYLLSLWLTLLFSCFATLFSFLGTKHFPLVVGAWVRV